MGFGCDLLSPEQDGQPASLELPDWNESSERWSDHELDYLVSQRLTLSFSHLESHLPPLIA